MRNNNFNISQWTPRGLATATILSCSVVTASADGHEPMIDKDASKVLSDMSAYLTELSGFSVDFDASTDVITQNGQKLKLAKSGSIAVNRPGQFRVSNHGALADLEFFLDNGQLTLFGTRVNGYVQLPATTTDDGVAVVRDTIGFDVPGADLLTNTPMDAKDSDVLSGVHVGMTTLGGDPVHHLAFRGLDVDWQLWVKDGDAPLPVHYVITSKLLAGAPEYSILLSNWNTEPMFDAATFAFSPPDGATKLTTVAIDAAGNISDTSE